jgi:hypothetical protein
LINDRFEEIIPVFPHIFKQAFKKLGVAENKLKRIAT